MLRQIRAADAIVIYSVPLVESAAEVLLSTVDNACSCRLVRNKVDVVILDEGGCVPEFKMPLLTRFDPDLLLVVGDHHQLPPYTECVDFNPVSVLERMAASQSLNMLAIQYRMHPAICNVVSRNFYGRGLRTAPTVLTQMSALTQVASPATARPICWITHESGEQESGTSFMNLEECRILCDVVTGAGGPGLPSLEQEGLAGKKMLIVTFYKAQELLIKDKLEEIKDKREEKGLLSEYLKKINVMTVDACQGSEADIVIVSTVRSNCNGNIGFIAKDRRRANVALSRAKGRLIIVGDRKCMTRRGTRVWCDLWRNAEQVTGVSLSLGSEDVSRALSKQ